MQTYWYSDMVLVLNRGTGGSMATFWGITSGAFMGISGIVLVLTADYRNAGWYLMLALITAVYENTATKAGKS